MNASDAFNLLGEKFLTILDWNNREVFSISKKPTAAIITVTKVYFSAEVTLQEEDIAIKANLHGGDKLLVSKGCKITALNNKPFAIFAKDKKGREIILLDKNYMSLTIE